MATTPHTQKSAHVFTLLAVLHAVERGIPRFDLLHWAIARTTDTTCSLDLMFSGYEVASDRLFSGGFQVIGSYYDGSGMESAQCESIVDVVDAVRDMYKTWSQLFIVDVVDVVESIERLLADMIRAHGEPEHCEHTLEAHMTRSLRVMAMSWRRKLELKAESGGESDDEA